MFKRTIVAFLTIIYFTNNLFAAEVNFQGKRSSDTSTGIAHITIADNGKNFITIIPAANNELDEEYIIYKKDLIINSKVLLTQNEIKKETTKTALKIAKENNVLTIFNPAPAEPFDSLIEILQLADIICPNEIELSILTSLPTNTNEEIEVATTKLKEKTNCNKIITTLGDRGCCVIEEDNVIFINTESVNAIDTVGAGDSFIGTLGANIARKENLFNSIIKALHCASLSVQKNGAQASYVSSNELTQEFLPPPPI